MAKRFTQQTFEITYTIEVRLEDLVKESVRRTRAQRFRPKALKSFKLR